MKKQQEIARYLASIESANLDDIYRDVSFSYYCNWSKHLGAMLSRMVKDGTVERVKPGVFRFKRPVKAVNSEHENEHQLNLFS